MNRSWTVATIRGIPIRIHITLLLLLPYIAVMVSREFHRLVQLANLGTTQFAMPPIVWGVLLAIALFVSVLLHELAHSLVAVSSGVRVHSITLMMLGGISRIEGDIRRPGREAWMAAAGPLTSFVIGAVFLGISAIVPRGAADLRIAVSLFGQINIALAIFNLLPAFPMDGGRILRAALTPRYGRLGATRFAATVGKGMAVLFAIWGFVSFNFILVVIAAFVFLGASAESAQLETRASLSGIRMDSLVDPRIGHVLPETPIAAVADRFLSDNLVAARVGDGQTGRGAGYITLSDLERLDARQHRGRAGDIARKNLPRVRAGDDASKILPLLAGDRGSDVLVVDERGEPLGVVSSRDLLRAALLSNLIEDAGRT